MSPQEKERERRNALVKIIIAQCLRCTVCKPLLLPLDLVRIILFLDFRYSLLTSSFLILDKIHVSQARVLMSLNVEGEQLEQLRLAILKGLVKFCPLLNSSDCCFVIRVL